MRNVDNYRKGLKYVWQPMLFLISFTGTVHRSLFPCIIFIQNVLSSLSVVMEKNKACHISKFLILFKCILIHHVLCKFPSMHSHHSQQTNKTQQNHLLPLLFCFLTHENSGSIAFVSSLYRQTSTLSCI